MQLIGITMMRNEADIVDLTDSSSLAHRLRSHPRGRQRFDRQDPAILERLARRDPRIKWTTDPGMYRQSEITTGLAREAFDLGADWIMPFDADEFWSCRSDLTIPNFLRDADGTAAFLAPVVNFVQHRRYHRASRRSLLHMRMRAIPVPPAEEARELVTSRRIGFVEIVYPPKAVFRAGSDVVVPMGNHSVENASRTNRLYDGLDLSPRALRSGRRLEAQVEHGRRISESPRTRRQCGRPVGGFSCGRTVTSRGSGRQQLRDGALTCTGKASRLRLTSDFAPPHRDPAGVTPFVESVTRALLESVHQRSQPPHALPNCRGGSGLGRSTNPIERQRAVICAIRVSESHRTEEEPTGSNGEALARATSPRNEPRMHAPSPASTAPSRASITPNAPSRTSTAPANSRRLRRREAILSASA